MFSQIRAVVTNLLLTPDPITDSRAGPMASGLEEAPLVADKKGEDHAGTRAILHESSGAIVVCAVHRSMAMGTLAFAGLCVPIEIC